LVRSGNAPIKPGSPSHRRWQNLDIDIEELKLRASRMTDWKIPGIYSSVAGVRSRSLSCWSSAAAYLTRWRYLIAILTPIVLKKPTELLPQYLNSLMIESRKATETRSHPADSAIRNIQSTTQVLSRLSMAIIRASSR
jgi:hypothetical protein